jgi:hypothetical protein
MSSQQALNINSVDKGFGDVQVLNSVSLLKEFALLAHHHFMRLFMV